jgi:hypothetical protein
MSDPRDDFEKDEPEPAKDTGEYGPGVDRDTGADVGDTGEPELDGHSPS